MASLSSGASPRAGRALRRGVSFHHDVHEGAEQDHDGARDSVWQDPGHVSEHNMPVIPSARSSLRDSITDALETMSIDGPVSLAYVQQIGTRLPAAQEVGSTIRDDPLTIKRARSLLRRAELCANLQMDCNLLTAMPTEPFDMESDITKEQAQPLWRKLDIMLQKECDTAEHDCQEDDDKDLLLEFWQVYHRQIGKTVTPQMAKVRAMNASKHLDGNPSGLKSTSRKIMQEYHCFEELERASSSPSPDLTHNDRSSPSVASKTTPSRVTPVEEDIEESSSSCSSVDSFEDAPEPQELHNQKDDSMFLTAARISQQSGIRHSMQGRTHSVRKVAVLFAKSRPRHVPVNNFKGFDDYKQKQQLARNDMLMNSTHTSKFSRSTQNWFMSSVEKPQFAMSVAAREHKQAYHWRLRKDLQQERPGRNFHRPWSREKHIELDPRRMDDSVAPLERFAKVCCRSGVHPQLASIRFLGKRPPRLNLRASGYGDTDIMALTAALASCCWPVESIDIGENRRLTDASVCLLLKALVTAHANSIQVLKLDQCQQLTKDTMELCNVFLEGPLYSLQVLDLSGIKIHMLEYMRLSQAVENHANLHDVRLADTGLGSYAGEGVISNLMSNTRIEALDISWNSLDTFGFQTLGKCLAGHQKLRRLALANTISVSDHSVNGSSLLIFLEYLAFDKSLTDLDISNNALNHHAPLVLESVARQHPNLSRLDMSRNPLGVAGIRSLLRLVASEGCPNLNRVEIAECTRTKEPTDHGPYDGDPSGSYILDLEQPGHRAVFRLLIIRLCAGSKASLPADNMTGKLALNGVEKPFNFKSLSPNSQGHLEVPTSGQLFLEVQVDKMLALPEQSDSKPSEVVDEMVRRLRLTLTSERAALTVFSMIRSIRIEYQWKQLLEGLAQDFLLSPQQAEALFCTRSKILSCARDTDGTCVCLIPCVLGFAAIREVARCISSFRDLVRIHTDVAKLLMLNLENPTGHYALNMSIPSDRFVVERLLLLNRWEMHLRISAGREDISEHGNAKNFRNEVSDGRRFVWDPLSWRVPNQHDLSFDYVSLRRPPADATRIPDKAWGRVLDRISEELYLRRQDELPQTPDFTAALLPSRPMTAHLEDELEGARFSHCTRKSSLFHGGLHDLDLILPSPMKRTSTEGSRESRSPFAKQISPVSVQTPKERTRKSKLARVKNVLGIGPKPQSRIFAASVFMNEKKRENAIKKDPSLLQYLFSFATNEKKEAVPNSLRNSACSSGEPSKEEKEEWISDDDIMWALSSTSSNIFLDCYQLRELMCILHRPSTRVNALVSFFARTIDWPVNAKMCRSKFCPTDWDMVLKRIGCLNILPFIQLENTNLSYDLSLHDQRLACYVFCQLHFSEHGSRDNLRDIRINWSGSQGEQHWSKFQAGLPSSWERLESLPTRGFFEGRYVCPHDNVKLRKRRALAAMVGGWTGLPDHEETLKDMIRIWSSNYDAPEALHKWTEFVMAHFAEWHQVFAACDEVTDGSLTQQEFVTGFKKLGFQLTPKVDSASRSEAMLYLSDVCNAEDARMPPEPWQMSAAKISPKLSGKTTFDESKASELKLKKRNAVCRRVMPTMFKQDAEMEKAAVDILIKAYLYLDPDGDMKVTEDEFGAIDGLWNEYKQSTWEFACHLRERFGSVEAAWRYASAREGAIYLDRNQFNDVARIWDFEGPVQQIFTCLDRHRAGLINKRCWVKMQDADAPPRAGTRRSVREALEESRQRHVHRRKRQSCRSSDSPETYAQLIQSQKSREF